MSFVKQHIHGIIGAIIFATIAILLLLLLGFTTPLPLPPEEGILLDFGGGGNIDAGESASTTSNEQNASTQNSSNSGVNTQSFEDAASMESSTVPNPNNNNNTNDETNNDNTSTSNQNTSNLPDFMNGMNFGNGNGTGNSGDGTGSGNPGDGSGTNGSGSGPGGYNGDVGNRGVLSNPKPPNRDGMQGTVKLSYNVDQNGNVSGIKIISTNCTECNAIAIATLEKWKYEKVSNAGYQSGVVTFVFEL